MITRLYINRKYHSLEPYPKDKLIGIPKVRAWCNHCENEVEAEMLPSLEQINKWIEEVKHQTTKPVMKKSYFEDDLEFNIAPTKESIKQDLIRHENLLEWRKVRKEPAKCLECGSTEFKILKPKNLMDDFLTEGLGTYRYYEMVAYDFEGNKLKSWTEQIRID